MVYVPDCNETVIKFALKLNAILNEAIHVTTRLVKGIFKVELVSSLKPEYGV